MCGHLRCVKTSTRRFRQTRWDGVTQRVNLVAWCLLCVVPVFLVVFFFVLQQSFLAASVALEGRKDGMSSLVERLMAFMFTQAFISDEEEEQDGAKEDADKGSFSVDYCRIRA